MVFGYSQKRGLIMIKQIIVIRKDLKMRRGKEIAQGAHASMMFLVDAIKRNESINCDWNRPYEERAKALHIPMYEMFSQEEEEWFKGKFTKICLAVNSEEELDNIYLRAKEAGLCVHMCVDSGATEFNGVATKTCLAIGPDESEKIDAITGDLKLY
jgi:PTH2 family peptidyl-tRNA hydrolase